MTHYLLTQTDNPTPIEYAIALYSGIYTNFTQVKLPSGWAIKAEKIK